MKLSTLYFTHAAYLLVVFIVFSVVGLTVGMTMSNKPFRFEDYWTNLSPRTIAMPFKTYFPLSFTEFLLAYTLIIFVGTLVFARRLLALFGYKKPRRFFAYSLLSVCLVTGVFWIILFLIGTPFSDYIQAFGFSFFFSVVVLFPFCIMWTQGFDVEACICTFPMAINFFPLIYFPAFSAFICSSFSTLDWDFDWQHFPIPQTFGTLFGYTFGLFVSGTFGNAVKKNQSLTDTIKEQNVLLKSKFDSEERYAQKKEQEKKMRKEEAKLIHKRQQQQQ